MQQLIQALGSRWGLDFHLGQVLTLGAIFNRSFELNIETNHLQAQRNEIVSGAKARR